MVFEDAGDSLYEVAKAACHWGPRMDRLAATVNALLLTPAHIDVAAGVEALNRVVGDV